MSYCVAVHPTRSASLSQTSSPSSPSSFSAPPSPDPPPFRRRKPPRDEIFAALYNSVPHKFLLEHFREEEAFYRYLVNSHEEICRIRTNELYQLLGMFAVFQGVVFPAVSQATVLSCDDVWSPVSLAMTACGATVCAVQQKLGSINLPKEEIRQNKDRANAVYYKIEDMKLTGMDFDFSEAEGSSIAANDEGLGRGFSMYTLILQSILVIFSLGIVASCATVVCRECICSNSGNRK